MAKHLFIGITILVIALGTCSVILQDASAHRDGCHRWHSCPSDHGTYECGDTGYCSECPDNNYCKAGQPISFSSYSSSSGTSNSAASQPSTTPSSSSTPTPTTSTPVPSIPTMPSKAPSWVKTIFSLHSQGKITDNELIGAIQFLVKQGIVRLD